MKKMLAAGLVTTIALGIASFAMAETNDQAIKEKAIAKQVKSKARKERMMPKPEVQLQRMTKGLHLNEEQQGQIRPVLEDEYAKLKEIQNDENLTPKQIRKQVEALRGETATKVQAYLTPEQKAEYELVRKEIRATRDKRMKENRKARINTKTEQLQKSGK